MNRHSATALLKNLVERAKSTLEITFITSTEVDALDLLLRSADAESSSKSASTPQLSSYKQVIDPRAFSNLPVAEGALLCVDFGTSFSKAFASRENGTKLPDLIDLPLGQTGQGRSRLTSPSELFIDDGQLHFGGNARKQFDDVQASPNRLIDSIKQYMTLGADVSNLAKIKLNIDLDPSQSLFQRDVLVLYLAHLMGLTEGALVAKGMPINARRRFAHPAWKDEYRANNENEMKLMMAEAIVLARSLGNRILTNMPVAEARAVLDELKQLNREALPLNLIHDPIREATAAGAGALLSSTPGKRESYLIVDVGAGTTDVAGCVCVNNPNWETPRLFEVTGAADAIRSAGNVLDDALRKLILEKGGLVTGSTEYGAVASAVQRDKRLYKEQLFDNGTVLVQLPTEDVVEITLKEFLEYGPVVDFSNKIRKMVAKSANEILGDSNRVNLVATGGGSRLPIIREIAESGVDFEGKHIVFVQRDSIPPGVAGKYPDLVDPYPQIAVAVGGSLAILPEQKRNIAAVISAVPKYEMKPGYKS